MLTAKNFRHLIRSLTPTELLDPGSVAPDHILPANLDGPHPPVSIQAVAAQPQATTDVVQVTSTLQSLSLDGSAQDNGITINNAAAAAVSSPSNSMVATLDEGQGSNLVTLLMETHNHFQ